MASICLAGADRTSVARRQYAQAIQSTGIRTTSQTRRANNRATGGGPRSTTTAMHLSATDPELSELRPEDVVIVSLAAKIIPHCCQAIAREMPSGAPESASDAFARVSATPVAIVVWLSREFPSTTMRDVNGLCGDRRGLVSSAPRVFGRSVDA